MQLKDEHLFGIIGVLLVHMLVLMFMVFMRIDNTPARDTTVPISFVAEEFRELEEQIEELEAEHKELLAAAKTPKENFEKRLEREGFEHDPVNLDQEMRDRLDQAAAEADAADAAQKAADDAAFGEYVPEEAEPFVPTATTKGTSVIEYALDGRQAKIYNPVYRCESGADLWVDIWANPAGYIVKVKVNASKSTGTSPCLIKEAERAAERFRFEAKSGAPDPQQGHILFRFLPDR